MIERAESLVPCNSCTREKYSPMTLINSLFLAFNSFSKDWIFVSNERHKSKAPFSRSLMMIDPWVDGEYAFRSSLIFCWNAEYACISCRMEKWYDYLFSFLVFVFGFTRWLDGTCGFAAFTQFVFILVFYRFEELTTTIKENKSLSTQSRWHSARM